MRYDLSAIKHAHTHAHTAQALSDTHIQSVLSLKHASFWLPCKAIPEIGGWHGLCRAKNGFLGFSFCGIRVSVSSFGTVSLFTCIYRTLRGKKAPCSQIAPFLSFVFFSHTHIHTFSTLLFKPKSFSLNEQLSYFN